MHDNPVYQHSGNRNQTQIHNNPVFQQPRDIKNRKIRKRLPSTKLNRGISGILRLLSALHHQRATALDREQSTRLLKLAEVSMGPELNRGVSRSSCYCPPPLQLWSSADGKGAICSPSKARKSRISLPLDHLSPTP